MIDFFNVFQRMNPTNSNEVLPTSSTHPASGKGDLSNDSEDSDVSFDDDDDDDPMQGINDDLAVQLASAGPTGVAAAAAISSTKKRKRPHAFETNPSIRKRQQTRLLRKLRQNIEEYSLRVGQQAVVLVATPGKAQNNFRAFGAKPLEDVIKNLRAVIMSELENALAQQAPPIKIGNYVQLFEVLPTRWRFIILYRRSNKTRNATSGH